MDERTQDRKPLAWLDVMTFEDGDLVVQVRKLDIRAPRFSISIGRVRNDRFLPFLPVFTEGQGKITVVHLFAKVGLLVQKAEEWVLEQVQRYEDEQLSYKQAYEERGVNKDKPKTKHTGKTERDREKKKAKTTTGKEGK